MVPFSALPTTLKSVPAPARRFTLFPVQRMYSAVESFSGVFVEPALFEGGLGLFVPSFEGGVEEELEGGRVEGTSISSEESSVSSLDIEELISPLDGGRGALCLQANEGNKNPKESKKDKINFIFFIITSLKNIFAVTFCS